MPTLRELQKRHESAETIRQLSGAMRSAATAKFTKLCAALEAFSPYAEAMRELSRAVRDGGETQESAEVKESAPKSASTPTLCILASGNRGLCGGYHQQLFSFFASDALGENVRVVTAGKKALDHCRAKKIPVEASFELSDVPTFEQAKDIAGYAEDLFSAREVSEVFICYQHFHNMLRSEPRNAVVLRRFGRGGNERDDGAIFIPDRRSIEKELESRVFTVDVYDKLLSAATGAQAATLAAMRSAYENANTSIASLEISINRLRQAAVTAGVLETATDVKE